MPLVSILELEEVNRARLIKIDVEGAEWNVAIGMQPLLSTCRKDLEIVMKVAPSALAAQGKTFEDLLAIFAPFGFRPYEIEYRYSIESYLRRDPQDPPKRLRKPIVGQIGLILSRTDAELL